MPNVLFILYNDFASNSAYQVHCLANALTELSYSCTVAVPADKDLVRSIGTAARYTPCAFQDLESAPLRYPDGRGPDIIHCWTPREIVRAFHDRIFASTSGARLVIHLEDNERYLVERSFGKTTRELKRLPLAELDLMMPPLLSHPVRSEEFLERASGASVIMRTLCEFLPVGMPWVEFWASADESRFSPRPVNWEQRDRMGIPRDATVIVYTGNVHPSNAAEVRSLYLAVAVLNREGHPAKLVRTGRDYCTFLGDDDRWARANSIELGFVNYPEMPDILAMADLFVQPGRPGPFNDYRFPSKIPEFCAIGRPLILPASNIGLSMRHGEDAYVLAEATAVAIATAVREIRASPRLEARLAVGSARFFQERLSWTGGARKLKDLYEQVLAGSTGRASAAASA